MYIHAIPLLHVATQTKLQVISYVHSYYVPQIHNKALDIGITISPATHCQHNHNHMAKCVEKSD